MVAYRRGKEIIISPGPNYIFTEGDIIVVIGTHNVYKKFITSYMKIDILSYLCI